jgi:hypothetical protein
MVRLTGDLKKKSPSATIPTGSLELLKIYCSVTEAASKKA